MSCDYTDVVIPFDYTKSAFKHANRKQFHNWKLIGMAVSHGTLGGIKMGPSGAWVNGVVTGCMMLEEINQNNHIIGRGAYYFRAKSDGSGTPKSAAYGILGHCNTPGIETTTPSDVKPLISRVGPWEMDPPYVASNNFVQLMHPTPWFRGWGVSQGWDKCSTMNALDWRVGFFVRNNETGSGFMYAWPDDDCQKRCGDAPRCKKLCRRDNAQLPGRFSPWELVSSAGGGEEQLIYRNCEAVTYDLDIIGHGVDAKQGRGNSKCYIAAGPAFSYNDILGRSGYSPLDYGQGGGAHMGVIIKLTSLPTCNHFDRMFQIDDQRPSKIKDANWCVKIGDDPFTGTRIPFDPITFDCPPGTDGVFLRNLRCERAVLRVSSTCQMAWLNGGNYESSLRNFDVVEKHYDRWDRANDGNYKLFDEIIELPDSNLTVRVLAATSYIWDLYQHPQGVSYDSNGSIIPPIRGADDYLFQRYGDPSVTFLPKDWFKKKFLTGGNLSGVNFHPGDLRGCSCVNPKDGDEGFYPVRPYTEFEYCANNFSCKRECTASSMEIKK